MYDRGGGGKRESETKIRDEKRKKAGRKKTAAESRVRDFKVNGDLTVQKSSRGWSSFRLVAMQTSEYKTLDHLMDKTEEEGKKTILNNLVSNLGFHSRNIRPQLPT